MHNIYNPKEILEMVYKESNIQRDSNCSRALNGLINELRCKLKQRDIQIADLKHRLKEEQDTKVKILSLASKFSHEAYKYIITNL